MIPFFLLHVVLLLLLLLMLSSSSAVRELTSQALHNLTERDPQYMKDEGETVAGCGCTGTRDQ